MSAPVSSRVQEVRDIAATLWFIPPPGRMMLADKLHGLGVRQHPELATLELEREGPVELGNHAPQRVVKKAVVSEGMDALRKINPSLAARIDAAQADPDMASRIAAANTAGAQEALAKEFGIDIAKDLKTVGDKIGTEIPLADDDVQDDAGS